MPTSPTFPTESPPRAAWPWRRACLAIVLYALLQWSWSQARGSAVERWLIDGLTVGLAVSAIRRLTPAVQAAGEQPAPCPTT